MDKIENEVKEMKDKMDKMEDKMDKMMELIKMTLPKEALEAEANEDKQPLEKADDK